MSTERTGEQVPKGVGEGLGKTAWRSDLNCTMGMLEIPQIGEDDEVGAGAKSYRFNDQFDKDFLPQNSGGVGGETTKKEPVTSNRRGITDGRENITNFQFKIPSCRLTQLRNRRQDLRRTNSGVGTGKEAKNSSPSHPKHMQKPPQALELFYTFFFI